MPQTLQRRDEVESASSNTVLAQRRPSSDAVVVLVEPVLDDVVKDKREDNVFEERDTSDGEEAIDESTDIADQKRGVRPGKNIGGGGRKRGVRPGGNVGGAGRKRDVQTMVESG